jgi:hypothetical protein
MYLSTNFPDSIVPTANAETVTVDVVSDAIDSTRPSEGSIWSIL